MTEYDGFLSIPKDIIFPDELNRYLRDQIVKMIDEWPLLGLFSYIPMDFYGWRIFQLEKIGVDQPLKSTAGATVPHFEDNFLAAWTDLVVSYGLADPAILNMDSKQWIVGYSAFNQENGMLRKNLNESEEKCVQMQKEIDNLKKKTKNEELTLLPQFADPSRTINSKIVELSKNLREKCAEMEKYKTKYSKLVLQLEELKKESEEKSNPVEEPKPENEFQAEIKQLQDKVSTTTNKMLDYKNANLQLRNELKQVNRLLQQEVGEDFSSLQQNSSWKGRAQIICDLQEKNKKLKEKLKKLQDYGSQYEMQNQSEKFNGKISALERENTELKSLNETYKTKIDTLKSRCNMLETGHQELKLKLTQSQERSTKELEIIANMSNQLAEAQDKRQQVLKDKENEINKYKTEIKNLRDQIEDYKKVVYNLKERMNRSINNTNNNQGKSEINDQINLKQQQDILQNKISHLEHEKINLLELVDTHKKRIEKERAEHEKFQQLYRLEKQKSVKFEAAVAKSDLESASTNRSRYSVISQSTKATENNLRDQLELAEENIKALRTRLELEQMEKMEDFKEFAKILKLSNKNV